MCNPKLSTFSARGLDDVVPKAYQLRTDAESGWTTNDVRDAVRQKLTGHRETEYLEIQVHGAPLGPQDIAHVVFTDQAPTNQMVRWLTKYKIPYTAENGRSYDDPDEQERLAMLREELRELA